MRKNYQYEILSNTLIIPSPPIWGKDNNPQQWWSINNYKILAATFCHKVEIFLKYFLPYLPKEEKDFEPVTPQRSINPEQPFQGYYHQKSQRT